MQRLKMQGGPNMPGRIGRPGGMDRKPNISRMRSQSRDVKPEVKPIKKIKATEIKAFLYAWCGQRKMKPEYEVQQKGIQPDVTFTCRLQIEGIDHKEDVEANNKKDAQSKAAWNFADHLVKIGSVQASDLPPRPVAPSLGDEKPVIGNKLIKDVKETSDEIFKHGGWVLNNSRQRLNQFCQREHCSPEFKHYTNGAEHARIFICELTLQVYSVQKEYSCYERGTNKKQATALAALSMVRKLFSEGMIERSGEVAKALDPDSSLNQYAPPLPVMNSEIKKESNLSQKEQKAKFYGDEVTIKRKACEPEMVNEFGNWTLENSRQGLNQFCQAKGLKVQYDYSEEGVQAMKTYKASVAMDIPKDNNELFRLETSASAPSKKVATQRCAHSAMKILYDERMVEAANGIMKKKSMRRADGSEFDTTIYGPPHDPFVGGSMKPSMMRRTLVLDQYVSRKHKDIYPTDEQLLSMQEAVRRTENALKLVAEDLKAQTTAGTKVLQGVVRIGALAKGLVLRDDLNVDIVLVCVEVPTKTLFTDAKAMLAKKMIGTNYKIRSNMKQAKIIIEFDDSEKNTNKEPKPAEEEENKKTENAEEENKGEGKEESRVVNAVNVTINLTCTLMRKLAEENKIEEGSLDTNSCLRSLAELRHAKWFQSCASDTHNCIVILRILRDMTRRCNEWRALDDWTMELLTARTLKAALSPTLSLGTSLQRVFETISHGIFLADGCGVGDPCEREVVDTAAHMTQQQREDLTSAAQLALRQLVFRKPHLVLGVEEHLPSRRSYSHVSAPAAAAAAPAAVTDKKD